MPACMVLLSCMDSLAEAFRQRPSDSAVSIGPNRLLKVVAPPVGCPSVFASMHAEYFSGGGGGEHSTRNYRLLNALVITNLLQAVNFAINFLLYFSMNPKFHKFFKRPLCKTSSAQRKSEQRYEVIHMRVK